MFSPTKHSFYGNCTEPKIDKNEAPEGYYAILKSVSQKPGESVNFCQLCDYRKTCQTPPCREDTRNDKQNVVFKKK